jgi:hypothetical protein
LPAPIDPAKRAAIITAIKAGGSCRGIAREHAVSASTVTKIAKDEQLTGAFERAQTAKATRAKQFDAAAARAQLVQDLYGDAQRFRARGWSEYTQVVGGPGGAELVTTKLPPLRDQQSAYTSLAICVDKAVKLEAADAGDGSSSAKSLLGQIGRALGVAAEQMPADDAEVPPGGDTA